MQEEPIYIPRKFRNDNYYTKNNNESKVITKLNLQTFQAECEILKCRKQEYKDNIDSLDEFMMNEFNKTSNSEPILRCLKERYNYYVKKDIEEIEIKWIKKIEGMKTAYDKDKNKNQEQYMNYNKDNTNSQEKPNDQKQSENPSTINENNTPTIISPVTSPIKPSQPVRKRGRPPKQLQQNETSKESESKNLHPQLRPERTKSPQES